MKRMHFDQPTEHYDERLIPIDEQICSLLKQRKEISNNNPGFPPLEDISKWADKFNLYEDLLRSLFGVLENDDHFRPQVEPIDFQKYIPVLKSVEKDKCLYSVTFIRQYGNASVVNFNIDWEPEMDPNRERYHRHSFWELWLGEGYDCRVTGGGGTDGHISYNFIVSPPLPDNISGLDLNIKEYQTPFKGRPTGLELVMHL
ncbi:MULTISPECIES: hypothetical protein [unclassified Bacillus (in: firmicutes)]|uniref:hypothetical protein n=1 Tax=unclassified Bacillus (in: firmicutes) TaxID=185979 RepID=UPI0008E113DA|nr:MULTISPECIES: hypothetical protein [unclassified Bacillus (in: firmicutes)]SFA99682.1 hypothetical protein SAMN02799634_103461 [Bacillus sp. UNCCL13]SFQ81751.1 hypothetical protein SAMN04488577_2092 [Bacillus sp. cl95]